MVVVIQQANSLEIDKSLFQLLQFTQSLINAGSKYSKNDMPLSMNFLLGKEYNIVLRGIQKGVAMRGMCTLTMVRGRLQRNSASNFVIFAHAAHRVVN